jgi:hypothetical protein
VVGTGSQASANAVKAKLGGVIANSPQAGTEMKLNGKLGHLRASASAPTQQCGNLRW